MNGTPSITEKAEAIVQDFSLLDDWEDRYKFLIELGDELPELPSQFKTEENRVQGCTSNVWLTFSRNEEDSLKKVRIAADSDARIVKGLVAILLAVYNGQPSQEVVDFSIEHLFAQLGLNKHLSRSRSNGLHSMVRRIRELAALP